MVVSKALFWAGFCSTLEAVVLRCSGRGCSPPVSVAAIPQKSIFSLFHPFCPISLVPVPLPALLPFFWGQKVLDQQQLLREEWAWEIGHPCSGLLPGLEGAAGTETWGEGC